MTSQKNVLQTESKEGVEDDDKPTERSFLEDDKPPSGPAHAHFRASEPSFVTCEWINVLQTSGFCGQE